MGKGIAICGISGDLSEKLRFLYLDKPYRFQASSGLFCEFCLKGCVDFLLFFFG